MDCGLTWPVGISIFLQRPLTVPLHSQHGRQMPVVRARQAIVNESKSHWVLRRYLFPYYMDMYIIVVVTEHHSTNCIMLYMAMYRAVLTAKSSGWLERMIPQHPKKPTRNVRPPMTRNRRDAWSSNGSLEWKFTTYEKMVFWRYGFLWLFLLRVTSD